MNILLQCAKKTVVYSNSNIIFPKDTKLYVQVKRNAFRVFVKQNININKNMRYPMSYDYKINDRFFRYL